VTAESLELLGRTLSDSFFHGLDRAAILEAIRTKQDTLALREKLVEVWGVTDGAVVNALVELGLTTEIIAIMALTPLVEVAWADGKLDRRERVAILKAAEEYGLEPTDVSYAMLEERLREQPEPELIRTWKAYIHELRSTLDKESNAALRSEIIARTRSVAEASGGLLGLGTKVSPRELQVLDELELSFG
jgi:hypothetical protein